MARAIYDCFNDIQNTFSFLLVKFSQILKHTQSCKKFETLTGYISSDWMNDLRGLFLFNTMRMLIEDIYI